MNYGIALFPSKEVQDFANSYRMRFDPHYNLIQPHLTIREKEHWDNTQLQNAVRQLDELTSQLAPITLQFNRFSSFFPQNNTIYLALQNPEVVQSLYEKVCGSELKETNKPYHFIPHVTVGQNMITDEMHDVLASLKNTPVKLNSLIDRLHLLYQTENGAWTTHQTFLLRGK